MLQVDEEKVDFDDHFRASRLLGSHELSGVSSYRLGAFQACSHLPLNFEPIANDMLNIELRSRRKVCTIK